MRLRSGHLVRQNDHIEHNKCSSGCLADSCYLGCITPSLHLCRAMPLFVGRGRQAITEPSQLLPSACWNEPQHHYLTHSRASGNQRESFELCRESGSTSSTMVAQIFHSPLLLSSSLLRCMTLLTIYYSFRLCGPRSKAELSSKEFSR